MGITETFAKRLTRDKIVVIKDAETHEILCVLKLGNKFPYEFAQIYLGIDESKVYVENDLLENQDALDRYRDDGT